MKNSTSTYLTLEQAKKKLEYYCAYQERCHNEVISKLYSLKVTRNQQDEVIVHLINNDFLNEERFSCSFARGKNRISAWGKNRIVTELKLRNISPFLITKALQEITDQTYFETLDKIARQKWFSLSDNDINKKCQKLISYLQRKGYELEYILDKVKEIKNV